MKNHKLNLHQVFFWIISAGLVLAPVSFAPHALAQQAGTANQQGNWGPAGPPPDAQNGQVPPPPAAGGQATDDSQAAPPPPPPPPAQGQAEPQPAQQPGQQGQWGPAGPPPDIQNGRIPPPPAQQGASQQGYAPNGQQAQNEEAVQLPSGPVTLPVGTLLEVRTNEPLDTKKAQPGDYFQATVIQNVYQGKFIAIPRGAQLTGRVVDVKKAGDLKGGAELTLEITSVNLGPQPVALATDTWSFNGPGKGGYTAGNAVGGAALGAVIGAIAGRGTGAAIGAAAGTGAGLGAAAATPGPRGVVPAESVLSFHLTKPATVEPVSYQEVRQLAQNVAPEQGQYAPRPDYYAYPGGAYPGGAYPGAMPPPPPAGYYPYAYAAPYPYAYPYAYPYPYVYGYPYAYRRYYRYGYAR